MKLVPEDSFLKIKVFSECRQNKYNERGIVEKQFQQCDNINKKICHYFALLFRFELKNKSIILLSQPPKEPSREKRSKCPKLVAERNQ